MLKTYHIKTCLRAIKVAIVLVCVGLVAGCGTAQPRNTENICSIFQQYPRWYWDAQAAYKRWGIPVYVQMAIIRQESSFQSDARPPRDMILGFIPGPRPSTAYGYAQALDGTWKQYQATTGNAKGNRDAFGDATDFLSWYTATAARQLKLSKTDAYNLYLAYYVGINGYSQGAYKSQAWLINVAKKVQDYSNLYKVQLRSCEGDIPSPSMWNLWLN